MEEINFFMKKIQNKLCENCKKYIPTYEVTVDGAGLDLCEYCFHELKWQNPENEYIIESHLATRESMKLYNKAIKDYLIPEIVKLIDKERVRTLLRLGKERGMDSVMAELKRDHQDLVSCFCIKHNLSYQEFIACLRLYINI